MQYHLVFSRIIHVDLRFSMHAANEYGCWVIFCEITRHREEKVARGQVMVLPK